MRKGGLGPWFILAWVVAAVGLFFDRVFNDTTGPPYDDPLIGQIGFWLVVASGVALFVLGAVALVRLARRRGGVRDAQGADRSEL